MYVNKKISTVKIAKILGYNNHKLIAKVLNRYNIPRTGVGRRKYNLNENYFDVINTPNKAYILGFLYADGCNCMSKQTIALSLQEDDKQILIDIKNEIHSERPLEFIDNSNKHTFGYTYKNSWRLCMFSKHMSEVLNKIGMTPRKSLTLTFPDINASLYSHFIRGVFDGDGCIHNSKGKSSHKISITSTHQFCRKLQEIFNKLGANSYIREASNHNGITAVFEMWKVIDVKIFLDYIYKDASLYMQRKYNRYVEFCKLYAS